MVARASESDSSGGTPRRFGTRSEAKVAVIPRSGVALDVAVIVLLWAIGVLIVGPHGDFPLNDDWSYGTAVKHLVQEGVYAPTGWTAVPLVTQVLWGSLFCVPTGFSFTALRLSTLVLSIVGVLATYSMVRELGGRRGLAVACALTLGLNPIYFALSHTFMTDVPFTTLVVLSSLFFARSLLKDSDRDLAVGACFAVAATLLRQIGVFVPLAFAVALILKHGFGARWVSRAAAPPVASFGVLITFQRWLESVCGLSRGYHYWTDRLLSRLEEPKLLAQNFPQNATVVLLYLGWFLLPVLLILATSGSSRRTSPGRIVAGALGGLLAGGAAIRLAVVRQLMPLGKNIIAPEGIGPLTLRDTSVLELPNVPSLPAGFWLVVTAIGIVGGALLVSRSIAVGLRVVRALRARAVGGPEAVQAFLLSSAAIYLLPMLVSGLFDRYLISVVPLLAACFVGPQRRLSRNPRRARALPAALALALLAVFAVAGTRDYLVWNRARWKALDDLVELRGVPPHDIDGGFEFNGWHLYDADYDLKPDKSWWWVQGDTYLITFGPVDGYEPIEHYPYSRWLPPHSGSVFALERRPEEISKGAPDVDAEGAARPPPS